MKTITYSAAADKFLNSQTPVVAARIEQGIETYALTGQGNVKMLVGSGLLRLRVGDYRIIFTETLEVLQIENIGHRKEIYR